MKKGKWSLKEEEQLIELVQKHGLGKRFCGLIFRSLENSVLRNLFFKFSPVLFQALQLILAGPALY